MPGPADHIPVLVEEVLRVLDPRAGETYADATAGLGGHAAAIAPQLGGAGTVILNDMDGTHLDRARRRVEEACALAGGPNPGPAIVVLRGNFADLPRRMTQHSPPLAADVVLADLGFSSVQMDDPARGLSFMRDGPLDMRLDLSLKTTAADLVNSLPERELADLIRDFGEDRDAGRIARKLVASRQAGPILTTGRLADVVRSASGGRGAAGIDPATRTFQALRIAVNDELGALQAFLDAVSRGGGENRMRWLNSGARVGVISFHSLEDRLVKLAFGAAAQRGDAEVLTRSPITPGETEARSNPRSRSAKLRALRLLR
ncbi:MAG: 16S rRNA (cytosine(1402)-N(4))-methyltransferase RsmH [Phycisphaerales bacterium]